MIKVFDSLERSRENPVPQFLELSRYQNAESSMIVWKETRLSTPIGFSTIINTCYAFA
jgi:hypothetical protein